MTSFFPCWMMLYLQAAAVGTIWDLAWAKGTLWRKGTWLSLQTKPPGLSVCQAGRTWGASNCTLLSRLHWGSGNLSHSQIRSLMCNGLKATSKSRLCSISPGLARSSLWLRCDWEWLICWILLLSPTLGSLQSSFCCLSGARGSDAGSVVAASLRGFVA